MLVRNVNYSPHPRSLPEVDGFFVEPEISVVHNSYVFDDIHESGDLVFISLRQSFRRHGIVLSRWIMDESHSPCSFVSPRHYPFLSSVQD